MRLISRRIAGTRRRQRFTEYGVSQDPARERANPRLSR
jgi:hypothetical protein